MASCPYCSRAITASDSATAANNSASVAVGKLLDHMFDSTAPNTRRQAVKFKICLIFKAETADSNETDTERNSLVAAPLPLILN